MTINAQIYARVQNALTESPKKGKNVMMIIPTTQTYVPTSAKMQHVGMELFKQMKPVMIITLLTMMDAQIAVLTLPVEMVLPKKTNNVMTKITKTMMNVLICVNCPDAWTG